MIQYIFRFIIFRMNCSVCLLKLIRPVVIGCSHMFCLHCICKVITTLLLLFSMTNKFLYQWLFEDRRTRRRMSCPECRSDVNVLIEVPRVSEMIEDSIPLEKKEERLAEISVRKWEHLRWCAISL